MPEFNMGAIDFGQVPLVLPTWTADTTPRMQNGSTYTPDTPSYRVAGVLGTLQRVYLNELSFPR